MKLLLLIVTGAVCCPAQIAFPDFADMQGMRLVSAARQHGNALRLTPAKNDVAGAAWYTEKQQIAGGFETEFRFQLTENGGLGKGADGLAFVLQNNGPSAIAGRGSAGGWALGDGQGALRVPGIPLSIAVFFDTFRNEEEGDPSNNYVEICTNGKIGEMRWPPARLALVKKLRVNLKDHKVHTAAIAYRPPVLSVSL